MFNMSTNKQYYQEAMRSHDRALSNLENIPQGFQHLVQMQKSMGDMNGGGQEASVATQISGSEASKTMMKEPFPNPWAPRSSSLGAREAPVPSPSMTPKAEIEKRFEVVSDEVPFDSQVHFEMVVNGRTVRMKRPVDFARRLRDTLTLGADSDPVPAPPAAPGREAGAHVDLSHYAARFHKQLRMLEELGFTDENENIRALLRTGGSVTAAIEWIVSKKSI